MFFYTSQPLFLHQSLQFCDLSPLFRTVEFDFTMATQAPLADGRTETAAATNRGARTLPVGKHSKGVVHWSSSNLCLMPPDVEFFPETES